MVLFSIHQIMQFSRGHGTHNSLYVIRGRGQELSLFRPRRSARKCVWQIYHTVLHYLSNYHTACLRVSGFRQDNSIVPFGS
jgi:hypothetical protein